MTVHVYITDDDVTSISVTLQNICIIYFKDTFKDLTCLMQEVQFK